MDQSLAEKALAEWDSDPELRASYGQDRRRFWADRKAEHLKAALAKIDEEACARWDSSLDIRAKIKSKEHFLAAEKAAFARKFNFSNIQGA